MSCYHHLSIMERENLSVFRVQKLSIREMASRLERSPSTISRELRRNNDLAPSQAQQAYATRRKRCVRKSVLQDPALHHLVHFFLGCCFWSPEQISHRLRKEGPLRIGTSTIYRALESGLLQDTLRYSLRIKYKTLGKNPNTRDKGCFSSSITDRPQEAAGRKKCGHFEGDTVRMHNSKAVAVTLADRCSRYLIGGKAEFRDAASVTRLIVTRLRKAGRPIKSVTFDRGPEFTDSAKLKKELKAGIYFAHPHSPWERPTNENTNGLLRQFIPKHMDCSTITDSDIQHFIALLNLRPRKCLNWNTPYEVFFRQMLHFT